MAQKKKDSKMMGKIIKTAVSGVLCVALAGGMVAANVLIPPNASSVQSILGLKSGGIDNSKAKTEGINMEYGKPGFDTEDALVEDEIALNKQIAAEGIVLLKNDEGRMPYSTDTTFSFVSHSAVSYIGGNKVDMKTAFEDAGFGVNEDLWKFYSEGNGKDYGLGVGSVSYGDDEDFSINECPLSVMKAEPGLTDSMKNTVPVFVFSRVAGEGRDMPRSMYNHTDVEEDKTKTYLEPDSTELEILQYLNDNFDDVVLLLNSSAAVDLSWVEDYPSIHTVISAPAMGDYGLCSLAEIFSGKVNPSGRTVDTYEVDAMNSPAAQNFGDFAYYDENGNLTKYNYVSYKEGIYVGYRYYETRYEDKVLGQGNAGDYNYDDAVMYPFGYGLSYTTFDWSDYNTSWDGDTCTVTVKVTNTGSVAGKDVVEVYAQSPYTDYDKANKVEKAAVELVGYAKTSELAPGASETVTVTFDQEQLKSYDYTNAKTYILDAGDYYFTAATDSHNAVNNILAAKGYTVAGTNGRMTEDGDASLVWKWTNEALDATTYAASANGTAITNLFDESDPNKSSDAPGSVTWMSRSDWTGTIPTAPAQLTANETLAASLAFTQYDGSEANSVEMPTLGAKNGLTLASMIGKDFDDPEWDTLLDQLTYSEMVQTITLGFHNTAAAASIGKTATKDENGPQGLTAALTGGASAMCYTSEDVMAATFNVDLINEVGRCIGEDCLAMGYSGLYGPGINMHRTAYSGRNFEYYSEDPFVAGTICAAEVQGIQSKGVYVYLKHVALNDSETSRRGVNTWLNEQTAREIYLEVADKAITDGGAWCVMTGFNRWGATWCGANSNLLNGFLREELGMRGMCITDFSGSSQYMDLVDGLIAGSDIWDSPMPKIHTTKAANYENDAYIVTQMRNAMHHILYTVVNSNAMNGWSASDTLKTVLPWWQTAIYALIAVLAVLTVLCAWQLSKALKRKKELADTAPAVDQK